MRGATDVCGCFPTGRHYPGIADRLARASLQVEGLAQGFDPAAAWAEQRLAVIDFETTGLSPESDRVLEIGVACFHGGELTGLHDWLVNPGIPVPEESRAMHNISESDLADAPPFAAVVTQLAEAIAGHLPVAYNAVFDRAFLHAELRRIGAAQDDGVPPAFSDDVVWLDPLVWERELHQEERSHRLGDVCARLGIPLEQAHRAAPDAEAAGRVLLALARRLPASYGELIRLQVQYAARQDVDMSVNWRRR